MAERKIVIDNIFQAFDFATNAIFAKGKFVSFGYVKAVPIMVGKTRKSKVTKDFDKALTDYIKSLEADGDMLAQRFAYQLKEMQNTKAYQASLTYQGEPAAKENRTRILGDEKSKFQILCLTRYTVNWKDAADIAELYAENSRKEQEIRVKYGFGKDEADYAENDWHRKPDYGGVGRMKQLKDPSKGRPNYTENLPNGFYRNPYVKDGEFVVDANGQQLFSFGIRQIPTPGTKTLRYYYFVNDDGRLFPINNDFMNMVNALLADEGQALPAADVKDAISDLTDDEIQYLDEIDKANLKFHEDKFLLNNILFMCGTDAQGQSFIYDNSKYLGKIEKSRDNKYTPDYLDVTDLNNIIIDLTNTELPKKK